MAYMRGGIYLWSDESGLHLWSATGYDGWDHSGWHRQGDSTGGVTPGHVAQGENTASGVSIAQDSMDEYVLMRAGELVEAGEWEATLERALAKWPRASLHRNADRLRRLGEEGTG